MCDCCRLHAAVKLTHVVYVTTTPSFMKLIGMLLLTLSAVSAALNNRLISLYHCYHCVQWFILIFEFDFSLLLLLLLYYNTITEYYNNIILLLYKHKTYFVSTIHHQVVYYLHCGTKNFLHLFSVLLPSTREEVYVFAHVCLSVCQDYSKRRALMWMKFCMSTNVGTWTNWLAFEPIHILVWMLEPDCFLRYRIIYGTLQPCLGCQRAALLRGILRRGWCCDGFNFQKLSSVSVFLNPENAIRFGFGSV